MHYVSHATAGTSRVMDNDDDSYSDEYAYALGGQNNILIPIHGVVVDFVMESGASCNTVNAEIAKMLKENKSFTCMGPHLFHAMNSCLHPSKSKAERQFRQIFLSSPAFHPHC